MKIKNIQILLANQAIEELIKLKLPLKVMTNYKLAQISSLIRNQSSIVEATKDQLIVKHGENGTMTPSSKNFPAFFLEWKEISDMEIDLDVPERIKLEELSGDNINIPINLLRDLLPFIYR